MIAASFVFSFGGGLLTGAANSALAEADDHSLAVANGFFGVGAIAGPLLASALVGIGPGWRAAPALAAVFCALPSRSPARYRRERRRRAPNGTARAGCFAGTCTCCWSR